LFYLSCPSLMLSLFLINRLADACQFGKTRADSIDSSFSASGAEWDVRLTRRPSRVELNPRPTGFA
jgi:hypothetical protein